MGKNEKNQNQLNRNRETLVQKINEIAKKLKGRNLSPMARRALMHTKRRLEVKYSNEGHSNSNTEKETS
jgi:hypothetical protein